MNSNVDSSEIAKFSQSAARWWDRDGELNTLHAINPLRVSWLREHTDFAGKKVLDIGCGGGILSEALAALGAEVTAIDMSEEALQVAKMHAKDNDLTIDYRCCTAEQHAEQSPQQYDVVTCLEMLEHVPDPSSVVGAAVNLLKPGGDLYLSTLNRNPKSFALAIVAAEYLLNMLPRGTHDYAKFIKPSELNGWLEHHGASTQRMTGLHFNPLLKHYFLAPNIDVNYLIHAQRLADLSS